MHLKDLNFHTSSADHLFTMCPDFEHLNICETSCKKGELYFVLHHLLSLQKFPFLVALKTSTKETTHRLICDVVVIVSVICNQFDEL